VEEKKLTDEIAREIAKEVKGVIIGDVTEIDLKTFKELINGLKEAFLKRGDKPIRNFTFTGKAEKGNNIVCFFSSFGDGKVIVVDLRVLDDVEEISEKVAEIVNKKNPIYQIVKALEDKKE
jgi:hypothetical protein